MPVILQKMIYRDDLQENPGVLYVFGDNDIRKGMGGQAREMRGEPNAVGIRTKWTPGGDKAAYFHDTDYDQIVEMIDDDFEEVYTALENNEIVVLPTDGVGTGLALLEKNAPRVLEYILGKIEYLKATYGVEER